MMRSGRTRHRDSGSRNIVIKKEKLWDPDGRISCTVRAPLFSVSQKRAAITK